MEIIVILLALFFLMFVAYRGFSVILFAPIAAYRYSWWRLLCIRLQPNCLKRQIFRSA